MYAYCGLNGKQAVSSTASGSVGCKVQGALSVTTEELGPGEGRHSVSSSLTCHGHLLQLCARDIKLSIINNFQDWHDALATTSSFRPWNIQARSSIPTRSLHSDLTEDASILTSQERCSESG